MEKINQAIEIPTAVFDSGATSNCGRPADPFVPTNQKSTKVFHLPTGHTTTASVQAKLHHLVREPARTVDIVPDLHHNSLLSASKFADAGYVTVLTADEVLIYDDKDYFQRIDCKAVLRGWRDPTSGLWRVPLEPHVAPHKSEYVLLDKKTEESIANVYDLPTTEQVIRYLHACAGFPSKPTWLKAIKRGNYASWPHLSEEAVRKHFPESDETHQGHMRNVKQGIRSTKIAPPPDTITLDDGTILTLPLKKERDVFVSVRDAKETMYTDQTGAFPTRSRKGSRYVMILCDIDSNIIISEAIKNRTAGEMIRAYRILMRRLNAAGIKPLKHVLDNKALAEFKEEIKQHNMTYELVPKGMHRQNIVEKAIQTWRFKRSLK